MSTSPAYDGSSYRASRLPIKADPQSSWYPPSSLRTAVSGPWAGIALTAGLAAAVMWWMTRKSVSTTSEKSGPFVTPHAETAADTQQRQSSLLGPPASPYSPIPPSSSFLQSSAKLEPPKFIQDPTFSPPLIDMDPTPLPETAPFSAYTSIDPTDFKATSPPKTVYVTVQEWAKANRCIVSTVFDAADPGDDMDRYNSVSSILRSAESSLKYEYDSTQGKCTGGDVAGWAKGEIELILSQCGFTGTNVVVKYTEKAKFDEINAGVYGKTRDYGPYGKYGR